MTKAEFWHDMKAKFERCDPTLSVRRNPDGSWSIVGGTEASRAEYKQLAAVAGNATLGKFPPEVE